MSIAYPLHTGFLSGAVFVDSICYLCFMLVFIMPSCLFLMAMWSPAGMGWPLSSRVCGIFCVFAAFSCGVPGRVWC